MRIKRIVVRKQIEGDQEIVKNFKGFFDLKITNLKMIIRFEDIFGNTIGNAEIIELKKDFEIETMGNLLTVYN